MNANDAEAKPECLRVHTRRFALRVIKLSSSMPRSREADVLGRQLLRAGTSVGAHWREAHRSRSNAEFVSKIEGGLMELEEVAYWLELLAESGIVTPRRLARLQQETDELTRIFVASVATAKRRRSGASTT